MSNSPKPAGVGVIMCTLTILATRLGGGIVGVPNSAKVVGYVTLEIIQVVYALMGMYSMWMLLRCREITGKPSYSSLAMHLLGNWSLYFVNTIIAIAQCGFPIIFFIVFGDVAATLINKMSPNVPAFWTSAFFTHFILAVAMLYLIVKKEIHQLRHAGLFVLGLISLFILLLFIHYLISDPDPEKKEDVVDSTLNVKFFAAIPTIITSYSLQPSLFTAFGSLRNKTTKNGLIAGWTAIGICFIVYLITPLLAFGLYGSGVKGNLLINISKEEGALPIILKCIFIIIAVVKIPIIFFIGKEAILIMFDEATRRSYTRPQQPKIVEQKVVAENKLATDVPLEDGK